MSYCVNCGVELDASAEGCPLCNTPVWNPREMANPAMQALREAQPPFPKEKSPVETANRKDMGILLSTVVLASAITCGVLNALVFPGILWSLSVIGACAILWVIMIPVVIYTKLSAYLALFFDGAVVAVYLYMLTFQVGSAEWFWRLGLPITALVTVIAEAVTLCIRRLPCSFLTVALYLFTAVGLLCMGLEMLIGWYLAKKITLRWSAVICAAPGAWRTGKKSQPAWRPVRSGPSIWWRLMAR